MATPLTDSIEALTNYINEVTGESDDNLSDAIATLADGYGSGGISIDDLVYAPNISGDIVLLSATIISPYVLYDHDNITSIKGDSITTIYQQAFNACSGLQTADFPNVSSLMSPGGQFNGCTNLEHVHIPKVTAIPANCFTNCVKLSTISLPNCSSISNNSFFNCKALTDIYLPNAESSYSNAPWGATNATIHYNTIFDENGEPVIE